MPVQWRPRETRCWRGCSAAEHCHCCLLVSACCLLAVSLLSELYYTIHSTRAAACAVVNSIKKAPIGRQRTGDTQWMDAWTHLETSEVNQKPRQPADLSSTTDSDDINRSSSFLHWLSLAVTVVASRLSKMAPFGSIISYPNNPRVMKVCPRIHIDRHNCSEQWARSTLYSILILPGPSRGQHQWTRSHRGA